MQHTSAIASLANEVVKSATNILMVLLSSSLDAATKKNLVDKHVDSAYDSLRKIKELI
jgi:F0F1-type ATP synthase membrane subunit b/b'